jgi:predicted MFS family arabinose efflux permease
VPNAIAFNSIQFNLARVIGPLLAGGALAAFGMVACFGLNGLSFLAVVAAILMMRVRHTPPATTTRMGQELLSGVAYVRAHASLSSLAALGFVATFLGNPILTFLPLFTQTVFHGDVNQYTQLMASAGAGAVSGALVVAWMGRFPHMGRAVLVLQVVFGLLIGLFASTTVFWLNAALIFCAGACMVMVFSMLSSLVQLNAPNEMRGRVMSLYMVAFRGGTPLGSLVAGWLATYSSAPTVLRTNGLLLSAIALWVLARNRELRQL